MTKSARAAKQPPFVPSRQGSSGAVEESGFVGSGVFSFPPSHRLIITTSYGVYIWDVFGISEVFRSGSGGIIAAKKIFIGKEMLAVADSQVVVLHDVSGGLQRSYRLKGSDGHVRRLKYANESKNLFFTTTLQNSVQSYSLKHSKLLDPTHTHPSPPSVFALSCTSQFLLSTSPAPPTIHLTRLAFSEPPVLLHPRCSSSAVVAAEFHPERENYFCIAFADGTAAVYDAYHFYNSHGSGQRRDNARTLGNSGEKAFIRSLHVGTMTKNPGTESGVTPGSYDPVVDPGGIGLKESGISAVAFVPGRKATVVTVGADGKCCVVDFTQPIKQKAVLLRSWHIRRPATCLSIICSTKRVINGQFDGADDLEHEQRDVLPNESNYIAVGRSDGKILLFDLDGKALGEHSLDDSTRVIDVEWTEIGSPAVPSHQKLGSGIRRSPVVKRKRKSLGSSAFAEPRPMQMELVTTSPKTAEHSGDPLFDFTTPRKTLGAFHWEPPSNESTVVGKRPQAGIQEGDPVVEASKDSRQRQAHATTKSSSAAVQEKSKEGSSQAETEESSSFQSSIGDGLTPPIPPRPNPKPGGRLSMRRAQNSRSFDTQSAPHPSMMNKARKVSSNSSKLSKGLSVFNPSTKTKVLFGPRKPHSPKINDAQGKTKVSGVLFKPEMPEDAWLDVPPETPRGANKVSPVSSATSNKSYKTALSQPYTSDSPDPSDDTVIDWTTGLQRQPVPTVRITHPSGERPRAKSKRKGHVSLSISSESAETPPPPSSSVSNASARLTSQSSASSPPRVLPPLPHITSTEPMAKEEGLTKLKGHVSLSVSSASNSGMITSMSSSSDGPISQWPSLKKSPRIPELSKGLPDPKKSAPPSASSLQAPTSDSTTDSILRGYADSQPPSPPRAANPWLISTIYPGAAHPSQPPPEAAPRISPPSSVDVEPERESRPVPCTCGLTVQSILEDSLATLRAEIAQQFEAQRVWFEDLLRAEEEEALMAAEGEH